MTEVDQFANWRKRLAGETVPTYENEPDPGYYRRPITERTPGGGFKKVGWHAVAFWREDDGTMFCRVGDRIPFTVEQDPSWWHPSSSRPITEELYFDVVDKGAPWPDMPHEPPAQPEPAAFTPEAAERSFAEEQLGPGPGHNNPPADDPLAAMREQIESAIGAAKDLPCTTQAEAELVQASRSRLLELSNNADKHRKEEKAPHEKAAKAVDAKYMPLVKSAKDAADAQRVKLNDFATAQAKAAREAELAAQRQREEADRMARERAQAEQDRMAAMAKGEEPKPLPPAPPPVAPTPVQTASTIKGASGKAAGVTMVKYAIVEDWAAVAQYYCGVLSVQQELQKLANRDAKAGMQVPGCKIDERADVR